MDAAADHPAGIAVPGGGLRFGRVTGRLYRDPLRLGPTGGRARRWLYTAMGGTDEAGTTVVAGAAVVRIGPAVVAFAFATVGERTTVFDARSSLARDRRVGPTPPHGARFRTGTARLDLAGDGSLHLAVPTGHGRLEVRGRTTADVLPVVLVTPTPGGGWNVTEKAAGTAGTLELSIDGTGVAVDAACGWRDWTTGRQDRRTTWRWVAGAGHADDGARIGINASTGMNGVAEGEDLLWVDGVPRAIAVRSLAPVAEDVPGGPWQVRGPGIGLDLLPLGQRRRHERLGPIVSAYTQPIGRWRGALPSAVDQPREVSLVGVAEDHLAVW